MNNLITKNLIPHFDLLISKLPDIVQKIFCTSDGAMDHTFKGIMCQSSGMFVAREIKQKLQRKFSEFFLLYPLFCEFKFVCYDHITVI